MTLNHSFIAEPLVVPGGSLFGVELLSRFSDDNGTAYRPDRLISSMSVKEKHGLLYKQLNLINSMADWFRASGILCSLNIDNDMAELLLEHHSLGERLNQCPFIRLEISEDFSELVKKRTPVLDTLQQRGYKLWLDDFGAGNSTMIPVMRTRFLAIKLDHKFFRKIADKPIFDVVIKKLKPFCSHIIAEGVDNERYIPILNAAGVSGAQGHMYRAIPFELLPERVHLCRNVPLQF